MDHLDMRRRLSPAKICWNAKLDKAPWAPRLSLDMDGLIMVVLQWNVNEIWILYEWGIQLDNHIGNK